MNEKWFLSELGRRIRRQREKRGLSLSELAERSELSRRYLTETEAGRANPSILKLAGIARALRVGLADICDLPLEERRGRRIALVGIEDDLHLKVGRKLAFALERPLVELERRIASLMGGEREAVRRQANSEPVLRAEAEALEDYLVHDGDSILVTGSFLFRRPENWERLLESCFVVWLRADIDAQWERVIAQGHTQAARRPLMNRTELSEMLKARDPFYSRAHLTVDTGGADAETVATEIIGAAI